MRRDLRLPSIQSVGFQPIRAHPLAEEVRVEVGVGAVELVGALRPRERDERELTVGHPCIRQMVDLLFALALRFVDR